MTEIRRQDRGGGILGPDLAATDFAPARDTDGSLDTTFDDDGKVTTDFGAYSDYAHGVAIDADGKIVVAGSPTRTAPAPTLPWPATTATGAWIQHRRRQGHPHRPHDVV